MFFHHPALESLQDSSIFFLSTETQRVPQFPGAGCVKEGLIAVGIKVSDSSSDLKRRELGVAPSKEGTEQSLGRTNESPCQSKNRDECYQFSPGSSANQSQSPSQRNMDTGCGTD